MDFQIASRTLSKPVVNLRMGLIGKFATCLQVGAFDRTGEPAALAQQLNAEA
jgi:hypothetical protein